MRTAVIGDIHGRPIWKAIVRREPWDRIVFLGDYFDSFEPFSAAEQIYNFNEIVAFKDAHPAVTMLIGNHDLHYVIRGEFCSGYQQRFADRIGQALDTAKDRMRICLEDQGWLMSHAGVTTTWCRAQAVNVTGNLVAAVNETWANRPDAFRFNPIDQEGYGDHPIQGPLWVRPKSLMACPAHPKQIVGHTEDRSGKVFQREFEGDQFVFADALPRQFVVIEDGQIQPADIY
jgi:hypothetical protein